MKIKTEEQIWHCYDKRLPTNEELIGPQPTATMIETIREVQLQSIGMIKQAKNYFWGYGTRRLKAIRINFDAGMSDGNVKVLVITGVEPEDRAHISAIENSVRSANPISDWVTINDMLHNKANYDEIAHYMGLAVGQVKAIEKKWHKVPKWAVEGTMDGKIALSVAIKIGSLIPTLQKECQREFQANNTLSLTVVKEKRQAFQSEAYAQLMPALHLEEKNPRTYYTRAELVSLEKMLQANTREGMNLLRELLSQVE